MNIRNSFAVLSYLFRMSANKLSYEKVYERIARELRKTYDRLQITRELRRVCEKFMKLFVTLSLQQLDYYTKSSFQHPALVFLRFSKTCLFFELFLIHWLSYA